MNIYKTLLTRGIRGTYLYVCDPELGEYFKQYMPTYKDVESVFYSNTDLVAKVSEDPADYEK